LVWRNLKEISQITNAYLFLLYFTLFYATYLPTEGGILGDSLVRFQIFHWVAILALLLLQTPQPGGLLQNPPKTFFYVSFRRPFKTFKSQKVAPLERL